jgi:hypothetical protein
MPAPDEETIQEWRNAIEKSLSNTKKNDIKITYSETSLAFPGGPHSVSFDVQRIDWDKLQLWAKNLGWHVQAAPEVTHPAQQATPWIRFIRITRIG